LGWEENFVGERVPLGTEETKKEKKRGKKKRMLLRFVISAGISFFSFRVNFEPTPEDQSLNLAP